MYVLFLTPIAGHTFDYAPGDVVDWPDEAEAEKMISRGIAQEITPDHAARVAGNMGKVVRKHHLTPSGIRGAEN